MFSQIVSFNIFCVYSSVFALCSLKRIWKMHLKNEQFNAINHLHCCSIWLFKFESDDMDSVALQWNFRQKICCFKQNQSFSIASIYLKLNSKIGNRGPIHLQPIDHINASDSNAMQNLHSMNETEPSHLIRFGFLFSLFVHWIVGSGSSNIHGSRNDNARILYECYQYIHYGVGYWIRYWLCRGVNEHLACSSVDDSKMSKRS